MRSFMRAQVALAVVLGCAAVSGCALGSSTDREGVTGGSATSPEGAFAEAGLTWPDEASDARLETKDLPDRKAAYAVTFEIPRSEVANLCEQLGGDLPAVRVPSAHREVLGDLPIGDGARSCEMNGSEGGLWFRFMLVDPGDPATVHVSLQHVTR